MPDRTINWGSSSTDAVYQTGDADAAGGGNFVVVEDTDAGTVLLEWDATNSKWINRGPVDMNGNDVTNVADLSADGVVLEDTTV